MPEEALDILALPPVCSSRGQFDLQVQGGIQVGIRGETTVATPEQPSPPVRSPGPSAAGTSLTGEHGVDMLDTDTVSEACSLHSRQQCWVRPVADTSTDGPRLQTPQILHPKDGTALQIHLLDTPVDEGFSMGTRPLETLRVLLPSRDPLRDLEDGPSVRVLRSELPGRAGEQGIDSDIHSDGPSSLPERHLWHFEREGDHILGEPDAVLQASLFHQIIQVFGSPERKDQLHPFTDGGDRDPSVEEGLVLPVDGEEPRIQIGMGVGEIGMTHGGLVDQPLEPLRLLHLSLGDQMTESFHPPPLEIPRSTDDAGGLFPTGLNHPCGQPCLGSNLFGDLSWDHDGDHLHVPQNVDDDLTDSVILIDESPEVILLPSIGESEGTFG